MKAQKMFRMIAILCLGLLSVALSARSQETPPPPQDQDTDTTAPSKPKPAARGVPAMSDPNSTVDNDQEPTNWQPDNGPATGLQSPTLGSPELGHSYWVPGLIYGNTIQSHPPSQVSSGWYADNYVGGQLSVLAVGSRSQFGLNYSGGGYFTTDSAQQNGWFSEMSTGYTYTANHWTLQIFDIFSYIPESQFGFAGGSNLALPGISGTLGPAIPGLGASIIPNQSIYSAIGPRYSNASAAQITYLLNRRSSLTFGGSYGILDYTEGENVNSQMAIGSIGYNYELNPKDSIGVFYRFSSFHYPGEPQALGSQVASFVYQRKVAQRVALNIFGGPQFTHFRVPVGNQSSSTGIAAGVDLKYAFNRGGISLAYFHGLTGGSGSLTGSYTDEVTTTISRRLGRVWNGNIHFGYSRNSAPLTTSTIPSGTYNNWFVGGGVNRPFGRNVTFSASYSVLFENSSLPICTTTNSCYTSDSQQLISLTLQFHTRPLTF